MRSSVFAVLALALNVAADVPECSDLGTLSLVCNENNDLVGAQINQDSNELPIGLIQGVSGLTTTFSNGCAVMVDRMFQQGEEEFHYNMACFLEQPALVGSFSYDYNSRPGTLKCTNDQFLRDGACSIEVIPGTTEGHYTLYGTCSHTTFLETWVESCKMLLL